MITGKNPVLEYLRSGGRASKVLISKTVKIDEIYGEILSIARRAKIIVKNVDPIVIDKQSKSKNNQGILVFTDVFDYKELKEVITKEPFLVLLEHVKDPHNLGAVIRTAEALGVNAVLITKYNSAEVNDTVFKTSAGAAAHIPIVRITNVANTIKLLKRFKINIIGLDSSAELSIEKLDLREPCCLVLGSEGEGLRALTKENCDYLVKIPLTGKLSSLNVSVSAAIAIYERIRQGVQK